MIKEPTDQETEEERWITGKKNTGAGQIETQKFPTQDAYKVNPLSYQNNIINDLQTKRLNRTKPK